ncbi:hypothetical protein L226DRAFT_202402 [Lentinus tigrinus ALCF2SS1-7]|uniref:uncharacterized protein n=1 Tax=Lentinus tigrinus ALCF2SS1-7 TaxID=1328758 RepID=UPI00116602E2|nr:hypothetical protein L226DRAFT_202402 [Lentinus tigrinus ALCF2SS1-7]
MAHSPGPRLGATSSSKSFISHACGRLIRCRRDRFLCSVVVQVESSGCPGVLRRFGISGYPRPSAALLLLLLELASAAQLRGCRLQATGSLRRRGWDCRISFRAFWDSGAVRCAAGVYCVVPRIGRTEQSLLDTGLPRTRPIRGSSCRCPPESCLSRRLQSSRAPTSRLSIQANT